MIAKRTATPSAELEAAMTRAKGRGLAGEVVLGVHRDNSGALAFFEELGFVRAGGGGGVVELRRPV